MKVKKLKDILTNYYNDKAEVAICLPNGAVYEFSVEDGIVGNEHSPDGMPSFASVLFLPDEHIGFSKEPTTEEEVHALIDLEEDALDD